MASAREHRLCQSLRLVVCSDTHNDHHNRTLITVSISDNTPYNYESPAGSGCFCGISITLLSFIAARLNYGLILLAATPPLSRFKTADNVTYDGAPADLLLGNVMLSICPLAVNANRMRHFLLVPGYIIRDYHIAVHKRWLVDSAGGSGSIFLNILKSFLSGTIWPGLVGTVIIVVCILFFTRVWRLQKPRVGKRGLSKRKLTIKIIVRAFLHVCLSVLGSFFGQTDIDKPKQFIATYVSTSLWLVYCLFSVALLSAYLSSSFMGSVLVPPFRSVSDFINSDFYPLLQQGSSQPSLINSMGLREMMPRIRFYDSCSNVQQFVLHARLVSEHEHVALICAVQESAYCQVEGFVTATRMGLYNFVAMFQLPLGSPLYNPIANLVTHLARTGSIKRVVDVHTAITFISRNIPPPSAPIPERQQAMPISLLALSLTFYLHIAVIIAACIVFGIEVVCWRRSRQHGRIFPHSKDLP